MAKDLSQLAAYSSVDATLTNEEQAEHVRAILVSGNYFEVLRVHPFLGRVLNDADVPNSRSSWVGILSYGFCNGGSDGGQTFWARR
jgi:hypothetical protein